MEVTVGNERVEVAEGNISLRLMQTIPGQPEASIKLMKMSKGYQWEIKVESNGDDDTALARIAAIDDKLASEYGQPVAEG